VRGTDVEEDDRDRLGNLSARAPEERAGEGDDEE
jgi:hypothetical protein